MKRAIRGTFRGGLRTGLHAPVHARVPEGGLALGRVLGSLASTSSAFLLLVLLLTFASSAALAAEIVDVRVGQHPTFTRVVFELDSAAGYQLSKASSAKSGEELVVILQASSIPRSVQAPRKSLLGLVRVAPEGATSIARIELKYSGLVVKERIMSSPYRVVLDVIDPKAEAAAAATKKAAPKAAAPPPKPAPKPAPAPAPKPTPKPAPTPAPKAAPPAPAPKPAPAPPAQPEPAPPEEDDLLGGADVSPEAKEARSAQAPVPPKKRTQTRFPSDGDAADQAKQAAAPKKKPSGLPKAKMADSGDGGFGSVLLIGGGVLVAVFGLLLAMRMRARKNRETEAALADEASESAPLNPFASLRGDDDEAAPSPAPAPPAPAASDDSQLSLDSLVDEMPSGPAGSADAADEVVGETELEATTISVRNADGDGDDEPFALAREDDLVDGAATAVSQTGADDDGDEEIGEEEMSRLIQQFEQRIAALESRLDEQAEARERLERQVAAQTEELRVQRAAIARTQRAVRNITRGEEDGPTEPALRDPNG